MSLSVATAPIPTPRKATASLRVLLHADDPITAAGVAAQLAGVADIILVDPPASGATSGTDVLLVVTRTATVDDVHSLAQRCVLWEPATARIVMIADTIESPSLVEALDLGVVVVIPREQATTERIVGGLRLAGRGGAHIPPLLLNGLLEQFRQLKRAVLDPQGLTFSGMSDRETEIVRLTADGIGTAEIARRLTFSEGTIKAVIQVVMRRYGVRNRAHLVAYALRAGII